MGYVERALKPSKHTIHISMGLDEAYDVDYFGMDDGLDRRPEATFRFLLQLGQGYMIYLYVVAAAQPGAERAWFHTFWTKDCAVAHVDMEEHGAPSRVRCGQFVTPRLYETFVLEAASGERAYRLGDTSFFAHVDEGEERIEVRLALTDAEGRPGELAWSAAAGWRLHEDRDWRALAAGERVTFR
jgi:hypothetical protein